MISFLRGIVIEVLPMRLIIEAGGVGYDVHIPLSTYDRLPQPGSETKILTHLVVREDAHVLYGFATPEERDLFLLLVNNVSGVGPKLALAVLNGTSPVIFRGLVVAGDIAALSKIKGVGKKTAERIIVELRDKVGVSAAWEAASAQQGLSAEEQHVNDAVLALISLGYKQAEAHKTVRAIRDAQPKATVEELVKEALKAM
ncbi:MAG: Holliday junction branch migration protein RuvA [Methylacidiphilales bacterium]|nr:Holliday junction branch migration protein RuvA [Candidatus Methylacidiphilales bacterium]